MLKFLPFNNSIFMKSFTPQGWQMLKLLTLFCSTRMHIHVPYRIIPNRGAVRQGNGLEINNLD